MSFLLDPVVDPVLAELFHAVMRTKVMPAEEVVTLVHERMELFPLAAAGGRILREAIGLTNYHGFGVWDGMLL